MARKRYPDEDILKLLREIEVQLSSGSDISSACRSVGISDAKYNNWRKRYGGMGHSHLAEMKTLEKEKERHADGVDRVVKDIRSHPQSCFFKNTQF